MSEPYVVEDEHSRTFWSRVDQSDGCWEWTGSRNQKGYGQATLNGRRTGAHRVAWLRSGRTIPDGLQLDHLCRNRACVNPDHLEVVDNRTNVLRGRTLPARNIQKTHCIRGHAYSEENTLRRKDGSRVCRMCLSIRWQSTGKPWRERQRLAALQKVRHPEEA